jgi:hypothetical protein
MCLLWSTNWTFFIVKTTNLTDITWFYTVYMELNTLYREHEREAIVVYAEELRVAFPPGAPSSAKQIQPWHFYPQILPLTCCNQYSRPFETTQELCGQRAYRQVKTSSAEKNDSKFDIPAQISQSLVDALKQESTKPWHLVAEMWQLNLNMRKF